MKSSLSLLFVLLSFILQKSASAALVNIQGGILPNPSSLSGTQVATFLIAPTETTWSEWQVVRTWAVSNGYNDLINIGDGSAGNHPVRNISWYDIVKWCNAKSEMEGLTPAYNVGNDVYRSGQFIPSIVQSINGYRLPYEAEWEWAARGGIFSNGYTYSGSNILNDVSWNITNSSGALVDLVGQDSGLGTWPVAQKTPNELGLYDMSGNVFEWCWEPYDSYRRIVRGGGFWIHGYNGVNDRYNDGIDDRNVVIGFRLAQNYPPSTVPEPSQLAASLLSLLFIILYAKKTNTP